LTLWEKGVWDDQDERIYVDGGGEALEALAIAPDDLGLGKIVAVGQADGKVSFVKLGPNKVVFRVVHDEMEGVMGLGFDVEGRLISGGGQIVKVWHKADLSGGRNGTNGTSWKNIHSDSDAHDDSAAEGGSGDSDGEKEGKKRRKKRKRVKGKDRSGGHHIMAFQGLD
jgi:hypothetical protein